MCVGIEIGWIVVDGIKFGLVVWVLVSFVIYFVVGVLIMF